MTGEAGPASAIEDAPDDAPRGRASDRGAEEGAPAGADGRPGPSAAELFAILWDALADLLGTAATATLVRRALRDAAAQEGGLRDVVVSRQDLSYRYEVPPEWRAPGNDAAVHSLRALAGGLRPLLVELTGPVVLRRLHRLPVLREQGIVFPEEASA